MPPLSMLIKPASGNCNLRCKYCFYHSLAEKRATKSFGMMSKGTLEVLVMKGLDFADQICTFAFQGGEPTLAGLDFFRQLVEFEKKYNKKGIKIYNTLQTNGIVMNDEWAKFLAENNFLVGLSLDGPKDIHDTHRVDVNNKGTFTTVMKTVDLFNKYKVEYNILAVVNSYVARHVNKVYNFFKKNNFKYLQFIPCLDPLGEAQGNYKFSLTPQRFTNFLKTLFDLWYSDVIRGNTVSIRYFDNLVGMFMGYQPEACDMNGHCSCQFVIEADGGTYPCDFYVIDQWYLGNIKDHSLEQLLASERAKQFIEMSTHVNDECRQCKWGTLCRGGCRRLREPFIDGKPSLNYLCQSYMEFFDYAVSKLQHLARAFSQTRL